MEPDENFDYTSDEVRHRFTKVLQDLAGATGRGWIKHAAEKMGMHYTSMSRYVSGSATINSSIISRMRIMKLDVELYSNRC